MIRRGAALIRRCRAGGRRRLILGCRRARRRMILRCRRTGPRVRCRRAGCRVWCRRAGCRVWCRRAGCRVWCRRARSWIRHACTWIGDARRLDRWCSPTDPTTANCLRRPMKARLLPRRCPRCLLRRRNRRPMPVRPPPLRAESRSPRQVQTATFSTGGVSSLCSVLWSGLMWTDALRECPAKGQDRRIRRPVRLRQGHEGGARLRRGLRRRQAGPACGGGATAATWSVRNLGMGIAGRRATQRHVPLDERRRKRAWPVRVDREHGVVHGSLSGGAPVPAMKNH